VAALVLALVVVAIVGLIIYRRSRRPEYVNANEFGDSDDGIFQL